MNANNRLTLIHEQNKNNCTYKCTCGNIILARSYDVKIGKVKSCGCMKKEMIKINRKSNSLPEKKLYQVIEYLSYNGATISAIAHATGVSAVTITKIRDQHFTRVKISYIQDLENKVKDLQNELNRAKNPL